MIPGRYLPRQLPANLEGLAELALDMRWSWNHNADDIWQVVDPDLWEATGNPWLILESISQKKLATLAEDQTFLTRLDAACKDREAYLTESETWFKRQYGDTGLNTIAYFSMEFGLSEALPI